MDFRRSNALILLVCAALWAAIVFRNSIVRIENTVFEATVSQEQVQEFARSRLAELQQQSFAQDVELCGLIAENSAGELVARAMPEGENDGCDIAYFDTYNLLPVATFHTHAGFNVEYDSEVPSLVDLEGDIADELDGYISTPGGRFWRIDWQARRARQICGEGCLPMDDAYLACDAPAPQSEYSLDSLREREGNARSSC